MGLVFDTGKIGLPTRRCNVRHQQQKGPSVAAWAQGVTSRPLNYLPVICPSMLKTNVYSTTATSIFKGSNTRMVLPT